MKTLSGIILLVGFLLACTQAYPSAQRKQDETPDMVRFSDLMRPFGLNYGDSSDSDESNESNESGGTGYRYKFTPFETANDFMTSIESQLRRLKSVLNQLIRTENHDLRHWIKTPEGANTTSTTMVINGHVLTKNETTYVDGDGNNGIVIRVRVFDLRPENETTIVEGGESEAGVTTISTTGNPTEEETTTAARSVETVEELDNETLKNQVDTLTA